MSKPMVRIYTGGGEFIDREMNAEEFAQYKIDEENRKTREIAEKAEADARAATKAALLSKLGITAEEAAILLS
jgi:hypothetical protein